MEAEMNKYLVLILQNVDGLFCQMGWYIANFDKDIEPDENIYFWREFYSDTVFYEMLKECGRILKESDNNDEKEKFNLNFINFYYSQFKLNRDKFLSLCKKMNYTEENTEEIIIVKNISQIIDEFNRESGSGLFQLIMNNFNEDVYRKEFYDNMNKLHDIVYKDWDIYFRGEKTDLKFPLSRI